MNANEERAERAGRALDYSDKPLSATFGGAFTDNTDPEFLKWYKNIGYVFVQLPTGERLQLFYNHETRLFVADVIAEDEQGGCEFVRCTVPTPRD